MMKSLLRQKKCYQTKRGNDIMKRFFFFGIIFLLLSGYCFSEEMIFSLLGDIEQNEKNITLSIEYLPQSTTFITTDMDNLFVIAGTTQTWPMQYNGKIKVFNLTYDEDIDIDIYGYNTKTEEWDLAGNCIINRSKGINKISGLQGEIKKPFNSIKNAKPKDYTVFSVVSNNGHLYDFKFRTDLKTLVIYLVKRIDKIEEDYKTGVQIIDVNDLGKKVKSTIEFKNNTKEKMTVVIYGFNSIDEEEWDRLCTLDVDKKKKEMLKGPYCWGLLGKYKYFAVTNKEGKSVEYKAVVSSGKLIIETK